MKILKKIIKLIFVFFSILIYSQEKTTNFKKVKIITIDYKTKSFIKDNITENVEVNDWVQFKIVNTPKNLKYGGSLTYNNKNIELRNTFGSYLNFNKDNNSSVNSDFKSPKSASEINKSNDVKISKQTSKSIKDTILKNKYLNKYIKKKVDLSTMKSDLEIGNISNYLAKQITSEAISAKQDLKWQKYLIEILEKNIKERIEFKDGLIDSLSTKNIELSNCVEKQTDTIYFPVIKIENYDYSVFSFNFKNKELVDMLNVPLTIKKGFKIDFSTGFIFNGLQNQNYKILKVANDNVQIKDVENSLSFNTGIAILSHAYLRSSEEANLGLTTGLSFNLSNQNLNYILGLSLLLGKDQRIIISAGVTAGRVKELVKYYKVDENISITELSLTADVPTIEKLNASWFFSLTYNLGVGESSKTIKF